MSSPPPPNPSGAATADFLKSVARQKPRKHLHPAIYQTFYNPQPTPTPTPTPPFPPPPQRPPSNSRPAAAGGGVLFPVASSGRGFLPNPNSGRGYSYPVHRPYGLSNSDLPGQLVNPSSAHLQQTLMGVSVSATNSKVVGQPSVAADNSVKRARDKNGDDVFAIIRDRKVQVSEGTSLYAQCRSWLKNGLIVEKPPQYVDRAKPLLPKPLPASMVEPRNEDDIEIEEKIDDVEHLSAKELLQQHVKRAKRVRARLTNQRLQRIERYRDRLGLLLPPVLDPQPKIDPAS